MISQKKNKTLKGSIDWNVAKRLFAFAMEYKKIFYMSVALAIVLSAVASYRSLLVIRAVDNSMVKKDHQNLLFYIVLISVLLLIQVVIQFSFIYYANWLGQSIIKDIRNHLFKKIVSFKINYFHTNPIGKLVTRLVSDVESIAQFFSQGLFMIIADLIKMLLVAFVMVYQNLSLALVTFTVMPVLIFASRIFQKAVKISFEQVRTQISNLNIFVQERLTGMKIVQLFTHEAIEEKKFRKINENHKRANIKTLKYYTIFFCVVEFLSSIAIGLLVWYGGLKAVVNSSVTLGEIIGFISMGYILFSPVRQIADNFNLLQMGMVSGGRVFKIIDTQSYIPNNGTVIAHRFKGAISFNDIYFGYNYKDDIIKGISFDVKPGETTAIVGATGAGKSTIINLINRFYDLNKGSISIDGIDLTSYELSSLRKQIAVVMQNVILFSDTIYNNIVLGNTSITKEQVISAAKEIGIHEFIMTLPGKYEYNVKERGAMLSEGQRQLISFLRAYVSKPSILILDEATSSIDTYSEILIQNATEKLMKYQTSIIIAHRLTTIQKANQIIVMEKGEILEVGNHDNLIKKKNGHYRQLYEAQYINELL